MLTHVITHVGEGTPVTVRLFRGPDAITLRRGVWLTTAGKTVWCELPP
ncbi:hypothetical protein [Streptomyces shaanxiensis]|uniref:Uncharacterized protein n=1 Tax=Streptomyces shaanxiensis TaxID=653357 RepID=A0ABP7VKC4_9ACTN